MGWPLACIVSTIAPMPPRSSRPNTLSASSRMISLRPPWFVRRNSPDSLNVCRTAPRVAVLRIASAFRLSEAFISTTLQLISCARASAALVFPIPGGPWRITACFSGRPRCHAAAHLRSSATAVGFPATSSRSLGRYFSTQLVMRVRRIGGRGHNPITGMRKSDEIGRTYGLYSCYKNAYENIRFS